MPRHDQTPHEAGDHHEEAGGPETERGGSAVWHSIVKWATRATVAGALLSLLIHLGLWMVAGFLTIRYPSADAGGAPQGNQVDFAVMTEAELAALLAPAEDVPQPLVPESEAPVDPATTDLRTAAPSSVESLTDATLDVQIDAPSGGVSVLYLPPRDYADPPRVGVSASGACVRWHPETGELLVRSAASNDPLRVHVEPAP